MIKMNKKAQSLIYGTLGVFTLLAVIFGVLLIANFPSVSADPQDWIIEGNSVYIDDNLVYINVTPHTSNNPIIEFKSKIYSGEVDVVVGFNTSEVIPKGASYNPHLENLTHTYECNGENKFFNYTLTPKYFWCRENVTTTNNQTNQSMNLTNLIFNHSFIGGDIFVGTAYWEEEEIVWTDISQAFNSVDYNFQGFNKWYYVQGFNINVNQSYNLKLNLESQVFYQSHKYFFGIKPSGETLQEAMQNGHFYYLDPWTAELNTGIVSYYAMDESSGTNMRDSTPNQNNGTLANNSNWNDGKIGNGLSFLNTSQEYVNITHSLFNTPQTSFNFWIKPTQTLSSALGDYEYIFDSGDGVTNYQYLITVLGADGTNRLQIYAGGTLLMNIPKTDANLPNWFVKDEWTMLTLTVDSSGSNILYVNGGEYNYTSATTWTPSNPTFFRIGATSQLDNNYYFNGTMDEFSIHNRTLSYTEVVQFYNSDVGITYKDDFPTITLNSPVDSYNSTDSNMIFNATVSSGSTLSNVTLYINGTLNETNSSGFNNTEYIFDKNFADGFYNWTIGACNEDGCGNSSTRTFLFDATPPTITLPFYANATLKELTDTLILNISVTDATSGTTGTSCFVDVNGTNQSVNFSDGWCNGTIGLIATPEGNQTLNIWVNDTLGNWGLNNSYVVLIDDSAPNITIIQPTGTKTSLSNSYNVSVDELSSFDFCTAWVMRGASVEVANTTQSCPNGTSGYVSGSVSVSGDANYIFWFFANDTLGNSNVSSSNFTVDTSTPSNPAGTTGGGGGSIVQDVPAPEPKTIRGALCYGFQDALKIGWKTLKEEPSIDNFFLFFKSLWDSIVCRSAGSIVPV